MFPDVCGGDESVIGSMIGRLASSTTALRSFSIYEGLNGQIPVFLKPLIIFRAAIPRAEASR